MKAGHTSGFDYLRLGLAACVVVAHSFEVTQGAHALEQIGFHPLYLPLTVILPSFFALSGFLVAGSLERSRTIEGFLTLRAIRLVPALAVEVVLCALVLGPFLTTVPLADYFADDRFRRYFLNVFGLVHFQLPGLFPSNPQPSVVNKSLWTVPYELECYIALLVMSVIGLFRRRGVFLLLTLAATALIPITYLANGALFERPLGVVPGKVLIMSFLAGTCLYLYRDVIARSRSLLVAALALTAVTTLVPYLHYFCAFPIAYVTVWLGLADPPRRTVLLSGDYSYGIYLFAYPIQQVIALAPWTQSWWINAGLALPLSLAYAAFSWHVVEAPILKRKRVFTGLVERWGTRTLVAPLVQLQRTSK